MNTKLFLVLGFSFVSIFSLFLTFLLNSGMKFIDVFYIWFAGNVVMFSVFGILEALDSNGKQQ